MASLVTTTVAGTASITATTNDGSTAPLTVTQAGTARAAYVTRNVASATRAMADFGQLSASGGAHPALHIQQTTTASDALRITSDGATAKFAVTGTGALTATSGTFTGAVTAGASSTFSVAANLHNYFYINTASAGYNAVLGFAEATNRQAYINYDTTNYRLNLVCEANNGSIYLLPNGSGNVNLYYGAANKLQTVTGGVNVNGTLTSSAVTTGAVTGTTGLFESSGGANTLTVSTNSGAADCNLDLLEQVAGVSDGIYGARIRYDGSANKFHIGTVAANTETIAMTINRGSSDVTVIGALTIGAYTLPTVVGTAGYHLQTDGAGAVTWQPGGGGTVTGSGTDNYIPRWNGTTALHNSIIYDSGASVGISSVAFTSPAGTLHTQAVGANITYFDAYSTTNGTGSLMVFRKSDSDTAGTKTQTDSGDSLGTFSFYGVNSGSGWGLGAGINISQEGASGASYVPAHIAFSTCTATAYGERMRITNKGDVGIGTTAPYYGTNVTALTVNATSYPTLSLSIGGTNSYVFMGYTTYLNIDAIGTRGIKLRTNDTDRLTITGAGAATFSGSVTVEGDNTDIENLYVNQDASFNGSIFQPVQIVNNFSGYNGALGWNTFWQEQNGWSNSGSAYTFWIKLGTVTRTAANAYADFVAYVDIYGDDDVQNGLDQFYFKLSTTPNVSSIAFVGRNGSFSANRLSKVKVIRTSTNANPTTGTVTWDIWMKLAGGWLNSFLLKWNYGYGASQFSVAFTRNQSEVTSEPSGEDNKTEDDFTNTTFFAGKAKVGIGTTAPATTLTVTQSADSSGIRLYGYDDKSASYMDFSVNAAGHTNLTTSGGSYTKFDMGSGYFMLNTAANEPIYFDFGGNFYWRDIDASSAVRMTLESSSGNLGIGTTAPAAPLEIEANGSHLLFDTPSSSQNAWITWADNGTLKWEINKGTTNKFSIYSYTLAANVMTFLEDGKVGIGTTSAFASSTLTLNGNQSALAFSRNTGTDTTWTITSDANNFYLSDDGNVTYNMTWQNDGNVGIGITDPDAKLEIKGTGGASGLTFKTTDNANNENFFIMDGGRMGLNYYPFTIGIPSSTAVSGGTVKFQIEEAGLFTVLTTGNVGIGATAPESKFQISSTQSDTMTQAQAFLAFKGNGGDGILMGQRNSSPYAAWIQAGYVPNIGTSHHYPLALQPHGSSVGIGTIAPANSATLDVRGRVSVRENAAGELQFGTAAAYAWMEAFDGSADRSPKLPIAINPWGGGVAIGTTGAAPWTLYVNGITKINGALEVNGQLAPSAANTYDLGNSTNTWRNLYLKGTAEIDSTLTVGGALTGGSTAIFAGDMTIADDFYFKATNAWIIAGSVAGGALAGGTLRIQNFGELEVDGVLDINGTGTSTFAGALTGTSAAFSHTVDPGTTPTALSVVLPGVGAGTATNQYAIKVTANGYNNATNVFGVHSTVPQQYISPAYALYGETNGVYGNVYGLYTKATQSNLGGGCIAYGIYALATSGVDASTVGRTYGAVISNTASVGARAVGLYVNSTNGEPLIVDSGSSQRLIVKNDGNVGIGTDNPGELLQVKGNMTLRGATNLRYKIANDANNNWAEIGNDGATAQNTLEFFTGSSATASMSILNNGRVGIGTTSPSKLLEVNGSVRATNSTSGGKSYFYMGAVKPLETYQYDAGGMSAIYTTSGWNSLVVSLLGPALNGYSAPLEYITFSSNGTTQLTSMNGTVGIGVTPEAWHSSYNALQIGGMGCLSSYYTATATADTKLTTNAYRATDGTWKRIYADFASEYTQYSWVAPHQFKVAGTAAADTAITWTTALTITSAANVGIGTPLPDVRLLVDAANGLPATTGTAPNGFLGFRSKTAGATHALFMGVSNASPWGSWLQAQDGNALGTTYPLLLNPNGGNVGIGTTSPAGLLDVYPSLNKRILITFPTDETTNESRISFSDLNAYITYKAATNFMEIWSYNSLYLQTGSGKVTALTINSSQGATFSSSVTAVSFSGNGASISALNALNISSGTVATARLGSGTANSSVFLRGDSTWATPANTTYTAGTGLTMPTGTSFATKLDELTDMTADVVGSQDELILLDNGSDRRKQINEIKLGQFNNDQGWTSNAGTVTSVTAGTGMTQSGTSSINPTLNVIGGLGITANANDIALNLNELVDSNKIAAGDKVAFVDINASSQSAICEVSDIPLSVFDNDSGWITSNWQSLPNISSLTALP